MGTSPQRSPALALQRGPAPQPPGVALRTGPGWRILRGDRLFGGPQPFVLLHPEVGVALLDIAPHVTAEGPERLQRALAEADFSARFPGDLPVVHRVLPTEHLGRLPDILDYAFQWQAPLTLPPGRAWADGLQRILERGADAGATTLEIAPLWEPRAAPAPRSSLLPVMGVLVAVGLGVATALFSRPLLFPTLLAMDERPDGSVGLERPAAWTGMPADDAPARITPSEHQVADSVPALPEPPLADLFVPAPALGEALLEEVPLSPPASADAALMSPEAAEADPWPSLALLEAAPGPEPPAAMTIPEPGIAATPDAGAPAPTTLSTATVEVLLRRGDALMLLSDISGARRFYERAATAPSGRAATALGRTFDARILASLNARGMAGDRDAALRWYRLGLALGDAEAAPLIDMLEAQGR